MRPKGTPKSGGRKAGVPNKLTRSVKQAFEFAFNELGGAEQLTAWARENLTEFYKLYAKLIPIHNELSGADGGPIKFAHMSDEELDAYIRATAAKIGLVVTKV